MRTKEILLIMAIVMIYLFSVHQFFYLPALGKHAWNEALYLSFISALSENNDPFLFYPAYDEARPDFNVGYLYFWVSFIIVKIVKMIGISEPFAIRLVSILSTSALPFAVYAYLKELKIKSESIILTILLLMTCPLLLYYGWKAQLEPFLFLVFVISQIFYVRYLNNDEMKDLLPNCILMGILIASRSNFLIFAPIYLIPLIKDLEVMKIFKKSLLIGGLILLGILITILPSQILHPEYNPVSFLYLRIVHAGSYASLIGDSEIENVVDSFLENTLWKQLIMIIPLSGLSLFLLDKKRMKYFILLGISVFLFFYFTHPHDANHTYQMYYGLLWFLLATSITISFLMNKKRRVILALLITIAMHIVLSYNEVDNYYGLYSDSIFSSDAYGSYESWVVGMTIGCLSEYTEGYALVQSPTVYYPSHTRSVTYYELYTWNGTGYLTDTFFLNESSFMEQIKKREISIMTLTSDIITRETDIYRNYRLTEFNELYHTKSFVIMINRSIAEDKSITGEECRSMFNELVENAPVDIRKEEKNE